MEGKNLVVDVNVFISALFFESKINDKILKTIYQGLFNLLSCQEFLNEFVRKMKFFSQKLNPEELETIEFWLDFVQTKSVFLKLKSKLQVCRDPKDDYLINLAIDGLANYLITKDKDILELTLPQIASVTTTPEDFLKDFRD